VPDVVEEFLRYETPTLFVVRVPLEALAIGGVSIGAWEPLLVFLSAANRDPAVFDDADAFRADRDPNPHLAFGAGVHFCLGAPLARMELVESLTLLTETMPRLHLAAEPEPRGTFVLRGYRAVSVSS
jgi:cytochrome P450